VKASDHFSQVAGAYAQRRPRYPKELFSYLAGLVSGHSLAWDCAAGSGQATLSLARHFQRVVGTDLSAAMLAQAPEHTRIEYRVAPAHVSGLQPKSADLITVAQALHWLDLAEFYAEVDRVLRPDGVLAVWTYGIQVLDDEALNRILERFYHEVIGPYWAPERRHVEAGYRTLEFPYPELDSPTFEMEQHWSLDDLVGYVGTWSATQLFRQTTRSDPIPGLARELEPWWGNPEAARLVRWPLSMRIGRKPV
jgi:ubiquinone/menaquinone biosynthesis C-methylase UbiE